MPPRLTALVTVLALAVGGAVTVLPAARATPAEPPVEGLVAVPDGLPLAVVPSLEDSLEPAVAETRAARRLLALVLRVHREHTDTSYQARTAVDVERGTYAWDCSGMMSWLLRRSAPRALAALASARPVARDYVRAIERAPLGRGRRGWQRLAHVADARPGDVFAFLRSPVSTSKITGHVGVVLGYPAPVPGWPGAYALRIADSTRGGHQDDLRALDADGGFGVGTMLFLTDARGVVVAYGWYGTLSPWLLPTTVVFGRVTA